MALAKHLVAVLNPLLDQIPYVVAAVSAKWTMRFPLLVGQEAYDYLDGFRPQQQESTTFYYWRHSRGFLMMIATYIAATPHHEMFKVKYSFFMFRCRMKSSSVKQITEMVEGYVRLSRCVLNWNDWFGGQKSKISKKEK